MRIKRSVWVVLSLTVLAVVVGVLGCGGAGEGGPDSYYYQDEFEEELAAISDPDSPTSTTQDASDDSIVSKELSELEMTEESAGYSEVSFDDSLAESLDEGGNTVELVRFAQDRIIVHTGRMSLVVDDVADAVSRISEVSGDLGGWVVGSTLVSQHSGSIAIRVPAGSLSEALRRIEELALEVESRDLTSRDVTDEYVDLESRLVSLRATRDRLLSFLEQAEDVEDALMVEKELSGLEERIEGMQGRLNYLSQTSAFSLIEVSLRVSPVQIKVDPGADVSLRVGENGRFRASFTAPGGIDEFTFVWDFGDGRVVEGSGSALRSDGTRLTATVTHAYEDDRDSPYIVRVNLAGVGEEGIAEGSASMEVEVKEVPTIEVFAGEHQTVEEGDEVEYAASFTRPAELWNFEYQWDFGDGSPTMSGSVDEGGSRIAVSHEYSDFRPRPYEVVVTVSAMSEVGRVSTSSSFTVQVTEVEGFAVGGWDVGETAKTAVRGLTAVAKVALWVLIWVGIFSPVVLVIGAAVVVFRRYWGRLRGWRKGQSNPPSP